MNLFVCCSLQVISASMLNNNPVMENRPQLLNFLDTDLSQEFPELPNALDHVDLRDIEIVGHRGSGKTILNMNNLKENTVVSMNAAFDLGCKYIETDVHLTTDNHLVIYHDAKIKDKFIHEMTYDEFLTLTESSGHDLNNFSNMEFVLEHTNPNIGILLEIKYELDVNFPADYAKRLTDKIIDVIQKSESRKIVFLSFSPYICSIMRSRLPDAQVFFLICNTILPHIKSNEITKMLYEPFFEKFKINGLIFDYEYLKEYTDLVGKVKESGKKLMVYGKGANNLEDYKILKSQGVTGFITDSLELFYEK